MALEKKWIITAYFAHYEELNYTSPSEEYYADSYDEALSKKEELLQDPTFEQIEISDEPEEREFYE